MPSTLPVELVSAILALSARNCRIQNPAWSASLLILSSATHHAILREVYYLFVVWLPDELEAVSTRSYVAFVAMLCNPADTRRHVIRHLAFQTLHGRSIQRGGLPYIPGAVGPWDLESVVGDVGLLQDLVERRLANVLQPKFIATSELAVYKSPGLMPSQYIRRDSRNSMMRAWQRQSNMTDFIAGTLRSQALWVSAKEVAIALGVPMNSADSISGVAHLWQAAFRGLQFVQRGKVHVCLHIETAQAAAQAAEGICEVLRECYTDFKVVISFKVIRYPSEQTMTGGWRSRLAASVTPASQENSYVEDVSAEVCQNHFLAACIPARGDVGDDVLARICFADPVDTVLGAISLQAPETVYEAILNGCPETPVDIKPLHFE